MRKIVIGLIMAMCLMGCQSKEEKPGTATPSPTPTFEELQTSKTYTVDNEIEFEIMKTTLSDEVAPSNKNQTYKYIKAKDDHEFISIIFKIKNISGKEKELSDIMSGLIRLDKQSYNIKLAVETMNYNQISTTDSLKVDETRYLHAYCELPENQVQTEAVAELKIGNTKECKYTFSVEKDIQNSSLKSIGDSLTLQKSQITLMKIDQTKKLEPSEKGIFFSYIPTDEADETFVVLQIELKNITDKTLNPKEYIYCEYLVGDETIKSEIVIESDNHKSISKTGDIQATGTRIIYLAMPVDDDMLNQTGKIQLFVEGNTFNIQE